MSSKNDNDQWERALGTAKGGAGIDSGDSKKGMAMALHKMRRNWCWAGFKGYRPLDSYVGPTF
jgi:hypothetical protein